MEGLIGKSKSAYQEFGGILISQNGDIQGLNLILVDEFVRAS